MQEKDVVSKNYLSDPVRFAQICNNALFNGARIIDPEKLHDRTTAELNITGMTPKETEAVWKDRDILKLYDDKLFLLFFGVENQTDINYCMPLRCMLFDALNYERQRAAIQRKHRRDNDLSGAEFVSGFSITDRLIPVVTLVIYYGLEPWSGPKNLHGMLDIPPGFAQYRGMTADYQMNLLELRGIEDLEQYSGDLKALFGFIKYQEDKEELEKFVKQNEPLFRSVPQETAQAIAVLANVSKLEEYLTAEDENDDKEEINMCRALEEMMEDSRNEGIRQERRDAIRRVLKKLTPSEVIELGYSREEVDQALNSEEENG